MARATFSIWLRSTECGPGTRAHVAATSEEKESRSPVVCFHSFGRVPPCPVKSPSKPRTNGSSRSVTCSFAREKRSRRKSGLRDHSSSESCPSMAVRECRPAVNGPHGNACVAADSTPRKLVRASASRIDCSAVAGSLHRSLRCASTSCESPPCAQSRANRPARRLLEMAVRTTNTRLHDGRVGTGAKHSFIMVRFEHEHVEPLERLAIRCRHVAEIVDDPCARAARSRGGDARRRARSHHAACAPCARSNLRARASLPAANDCAQISFSSG